MIQKKSCYLAREYMRKFYLVVFNQFYKFHGTAAKIRAVEYVGLFSLFGLLAFQPF